METAAVFLTTGTTHTILAVNPEKIMRARSDRSLRNALESAALLLPDGIGAVYAARLLACHPVERVPGSEFMPALLKLAKREQKRTYFLGGRPETIERMVEVVRAQHPDLVIAGYTHGFFEDRDSKRVVQRINDCGADILFVALGSPKQELWIEEHRNQLNVKICQGVGGTFDVIAGVTKRAPGPFIALNLEWLYRLLREPQRLRRQLVLPEFGSLVLAEFVRSRFTASH